MSFTSLVEFISKYFIPFDAIVNGIAFFFKKDLFIFGCAGSSLPHVDFLWLQQAGTTLWLQCMGFSFAVASLVEQALWGTQASVVLAPGLTCFAACGIFPDQGSNPGLLQWQVESGPVSHQGSLGIVFLISLSESSILTYYGNATDFCILILYPTTYWICFILTGFGFYGVIGIFYTYNMSSVNSGSFTSSFLIWMPFLSCLTAMARSPNTVLNKSGVREHSYLVLHLRRSDFSFAPLSLMLAVGLACVHACYATSVMSDSLWPYEL